VYVTPNSLNGGSKSEFVVFVNKNQFKSNKLCYSVLCVKRFSGKVVVEAFPYLTVQMLAVNVTFNLTVSVKVTHSL